MDDFYCEEIFSYYKWFYNWGMFDDLDFEFEDFNLFCGD